MSRLEDAHVKDLTWTEDEDGNVFAEGIQSYEIAAGEVEIAIFQGPKCTDIRWARDFDHAVSVIQACESVCRWHLKMGVTWHGHAINEYGTQAK